MDQVLPRPSVVECRGNTQWSLCELGGGQGCINTFGTDNGIYHSYEIQMLFQPRVVLRFSGGLTKTHLHLMIGMAISTLTTVTGSFLAHLITNKRQLNLNLYTVQHLYGVHLLTAFTVTPKIVHFNSINLQKSNSVNIF